MIEWIGAIGGILLVYYFYFWKINVVKNYKYKKDGNNNIRYKNPRTKNLPPVYPNGWFGLLKSTELKKSQVKYVTALGEHFAVFRTESGIVNVIDAYCPHLGANIGVGGKVKGECIECPFHSWTFSGDGQCQSIPYSSSVMSGIKIKNWTCREVNKIIWVWYHAELQNPDWEIEPIPQIENNQWCYQGQNEYFVNCHIQEIPENGSDWSHLNVVHIPAMFLDSVSPEVIRHEWSGGGWYPPESIASMLDSEILQNNTKNTGVISNSKIHNNNGDVKPIIYEEKYQNGDKHKLNNEYEQRTNVMKHKATFHLIHELKLLDKYKILHLDVRGEQVGPGYVLLNVKTAYGPLCIIQTVTPIEPLVQRVMNIMYAPFIISPYAKIVFYGMCNMIERDIAVWNEKIFFKNPALVKEERRIATFRRWYSQFYSPNSPTYKSLLSLDW